ncbi:MAG: nucleotide exchange factor GrpE [Dehalococcoidia bacterium]|nr:nucleotide exchange factor GrpE [Dehalococcoidia bacterium]MQG16064.1 nucleotide exchange factor GrpE [SAR202 cluster bacterium]|tara:strand:+ start:120999 stop:121538 length:540 start_codon:yes stop_codon:yes gene_type:complete
MIGETEKNSDDQAEEAKDAGIEEPIDSSMNEIDIAIKEAEKYKDLAHRTAAELENLKKRSLQEREEIRKYGQSQLIIQLLGVLDDFNRAMDIIPDEAVVTGWKDGLDLVKRGMDNLLAAQGLSQIDALGKPFEPAEHEAVSFEPVEGQAAGRVLSVVREGYKLNGRVLRAAQVTVSKAT